MQEFASSRNDFQWPTLVHPTSVVDTATCDIGQGTLVAAGCVLTTSIRVGEFAVLNPQVLLSHDVEVGSGGSLFGQARIAGAVKIGDRCLRHCRGWRPKIGYLLLKRVYDVIAALLALAILAPLLGIVALAVLVFLGRPVLFLQERTGYLGKTFTLYKFRSMTSSNSKVVDVEADAQRLSSFGRILRKLSLDELPQLLNVVRGDMSLVGPRPLLPEYLPLYS